MLTTCPDPFHRHNKSMLTLTLASFVPIMLLPSAEDLCIFDIKFLLSSRLLSCWLFLTRWPRSPNFPIFNAGRAHPRPQISLAPPLLNSVGPLLLACAVCTVLELQCAALSPSCTLKPTEQCSPLNNVLLFTNRVAPVHSGSWLADGFLNVIFSPMEALQITACSLNVWEFYRILFEFQSDSDASFIIVDAQWQSATPSSYLTSMSPRQASLCCPAC